MGKEHKILSNIFLPRGSSAVYICSTYDGGQTSYHELLCTVEKSVSLTYSSN